MLVVSLTANSTEMKKYGITRLKSLNGNDEYYEYEVTEIKKGPEADEITYEPITTIKHRFLDGITTLTAIAMTNIARHRKPYAAS
tara:strand:+ start:370 stop:624 length:255 start_codon:yes stop_codon:yes gene_type:complete